MFSPTPRTELEFSAQDTGEPRLRCEVLDYSLSETAAQSADECSLVLGRTDQVSAPLVRETCCRQQSSLRSTLDTSESQAFIGKSAHENEILFLYVIITTFDAL